MIIEVNCFVCLFFKTKLQEVTKNQYLKIKKVLDFCNKQSVIQAINTLFIIHGGAELLQQLPCTLLPHPSHLVQIIPCSLGFEKQNNICRISFHKSPCGALTAHFLRCIEHLHYCKYERISNEMFLKAATEILCRNLLPGFPKIKEIS